MLLPFSVVEHARALVQCVSAETRCRQSFVASETGEPGTKASAKISHWQWYCVRPRLCMTAYAVLEKVECM
jgi:hypothetical protein